MGGGSPCSLLTCGQDRPPLSTTGAVLWEEYRGSSTAGAVPRGGARLQTVSVSIRSGSHWLRLRAASLTSEPAWAHLCNGGWEASALRVVVVMGSVLEYVKGSEMFVSLFSSF